MYKTRKLFDENIDGNKLTFVHNDSSLVEWVFAAIRNDTGGKTESICPSPITTKSWSFRDLIHYKLAISNDHHKISLTPREGMGLFFLAHFSLHITPNY